MRRPQTFGATFLLACVAAMASACGSQAPTAPAPSVVRDLSGSWTGEQTVTGVEEGECLAPLFREMVGTPSQFHATFIQNGPDIVATMTLDHTGAVCTYLGSVGPSGLVVLGRTACTAPQVTNLSCPGRGTRGLRVANIVVTGTLDAPDAISASALETDEVVASETQETVGRLVLRTAVRLSRN